MSIFSAYSIVLFCFFCFSLIDVLL